MGGSILELQPVSGLTLAAAQRRVAQAFAAAGLETPALDARLLVAGALGLDRAAMVRAPERSIAPTEVKRIEAFAARRLAREPVSRILGTRAFHGLEFEIGPATLDPRPETETLVDGVLRLVAGGETPGGVAPRILDLGTGSGAILIALLAALPEASGLATDISMEALAVAGRNAGRHGFAGRIRLLKSDWLADVNGLFDVVVSNPPYIESAGIKSLAPEVAEHDPRAALDGGADGLEAYRAIIATAGRVLSNGAWLALEHGVGQDKAVQQLCNDAGSFESGTGFRRWPDFSGRIRCVAVKARR